MTFMIGNQNLDIYVNSWSTLNLIAKILNKRTVLTIAYLVDTFQDIFIA